MIAILAENKYFLIKKNTLLVKSCFFRRQGDQSETNSGKIFKGSVLLNKMKTSSNYIPDLINL